MGSEFQDIRTLANINHFKIIKFHWTIDACFESKTLRCRTLQTYQCIKNNNNNNLILDTKDITVQQVEVNGTEAPSKLGACVESLGQPLEISLPSHLCDASCSTFEVEIVLTVCFRYSVAVARTNTGKEATLYVHAMSTSACAIAAAVSRFPWL